MRLLAPGIFTALVNIVLCSIRGIGEASIRCVRENREMECPVCLERLLDGPSPIYVLYLAACQQASQHVFHTECLAKALVGTADAQMVCQIGRAHV